MDIEGNNLMTDLSMVPEKDVDDVAVAMAAAAVGESPMVEAYTLGAQAEAAFNQQRVVVSRLPRDELEDRYLRLMEESVVIKKHAGKQARATFRFVTSDPKYSHVQRCGFRRKKSKSWQQSWSVYCLTKNVWSLAAAETE